MLGGGLDAHLVVMVMTASIMTMMLDRQEEVVAMEMRRNYRRITGNVDMQSKHARDIHDDKHWRGAMDISHVIRHKPRQGSIQVQCTAVAISRSSSDISILFTPPPLLLRASAITQVKAW